MQQKVFITLPASQIGVANQAEPWEGRRVLWVGGQGASRAQEGSGQEMAKIFVSCCVVNLYPRALYSATDGNLSKMASTACAISGGGATLLSLQGLPT